MPHRRTNLIQIYHTKQKLYATGAVTTLQRGGQKVCISIVCTRFVYIVSIWKWISVPMIESFKVSSPYGPTHETCLCQTQMIVCGEANGDIILK